MTPPPAKLLTKIRRRPSLALAALVLADGLAGEVDVLAAEDIVH